MDEQVVTIYRLPRDNGWYAGWNAADGSWESEGPFDTAEDASKFCPCRFDPARVTRVVKAKRQIIIGPGTPHVRPVDASKGGR